MKFLIDECLSPKLAQMAIDAGYGESAHVTYRGMAGTMDWNLASYAVDDDWTLVTKNSVDFRGPVDEPGTGGEYMDIDLHAGLVCLNGDDMDRQMQIDLFAAVLEDLQADPDLVNMCVEATAQEDGGIAVERYALPIAVAPAEDP